MRFQNPANGYVEEVERPALWTFLFGGFYFAYHGIWTHFAISFCLAMLIIPWLIYPFFAERIIEKHYGRIGWKRLP